VVSAHPPCELQPSPFLASPSLDKAGWSSVLHLSDMWQMQSLRADALKHLEPITSDVEKLALADKYDIPHWLLPALVALVNRDKALSIEESEKIGLVRAIKVPGLRERRLRSVPPCQGVTGDGQGRVIFHACHCGQDVSAHLCRSCGAQGNAATALWTVSYKCSCTTLECNRCGRSGTTVTSRNILDPAEVGREFGLPYEPAETANDTSSLIEAIRTNLCALGI
jgi:hypothetical protein